MPWSDEERERELFSKRGNKVPGKPAAEWEQVYEGTEANRDTHAEKNKKTSKNGHQSLVKGHVYETMDIAYSLFLSPHLLRIRWYQCLVDCGLYWSDHCGGSGGEHSEATVTLLLDKQLVELLKGSEHGSEQQIEIVKMIEYGEERGLEVDCVLPFYSKWQKQSQKKWQWSSWFVSSSNFTLNFLSP